VRDDAPLAPGTVFGERYEIARLIGAGTMGSVYEATTSRGDHVALKALATDDVKSDAAERRARFEREAAVSATLAHPNIVPVLDHGVDTATDTPFLIMPLLRGEDLGRALERTGALEPGLCVGLFVQACAGLEAAHRAGVVHRDVKPANLFLEEDTTGAIVVKIADFGLAKVFDDASPSLTASRRFMGTPHYVSPEQATNAKRVDARSDVWSLAMSLYHALAGAPAFARVRSFMQLVLELTGPNGVRPLQDAAPWIDGRLARVVHGALISDLALRCPTAADLGVALEMAAGFDAAHARAARADIRAASKARRAEHAEGADMPTSWDELLRFG
jgi:eukaryotic-like serine/threonine-protein kinase